MKEKSKSSAKDWVRRALVREGTKRPVVTQKDPESSTTHMGEAVHRTAKWWGEIISLFLISLLLREKAQWSQVERLSYRVVWKTCFQLCTKCDIWRTPNTAHYTENNIPRTSTIGGGRIMLSSAGKLVRPEGKKTGRRQIEGKLKRKAVLVCKILDWNGGVRTDQSQLRAQPGLWDLDLEISVYQNGGLCPIWQSWAMSPRTRGKIIRIQMCMSQKKCVKVESVSGESVCEWVSQSVSLSESVSECEWVNQ